MSNEHSILFSGEMVRALLDGRKTQTRRLMKPQPVDAPRLPDGPDAVSADLRCPFGVPGDRLWVRETWGVVEPYPGVTESYAVPGTKAWTGHDFADLSPRVQGFWRGRIAYRATDPNADVRVVRDGEPESAWRPSIFMPRWASRILLDVVDVRVERLQDISEEDALAEGCSGHVPEPLDEGGTIYAWQGRSSAPSARAHFAVLWDSINGKRAPWSSNPWVWVVSFKRVVSSHEEES